MAWVNISKLDAASRLNIWMQIRNLHQRGIVNGIIYAGSPDGFLARSKLARELSFILNANFVVSVSDNRTLSIETEVSDEEYSWICLTDPHK